MSTLHISDPPDNPEEGPQCSPTVVVDSRYPHEMVLSCWEHGTICTLGYSVKADFITEQVDDHRARLGPT